MICTVALAHKHTHTHTHTHAHAHQRTLICTNPIVSLKVMIYAYTSIYVWS